MNQKQAKNLRYFARKIAEPDAPNIEYMVKNHYKSVVDPINPTKLVKRKKIEVRLNPNCIRAYYQEMKKEYKEMARKSGR
jgi:hypothetical protein